MSSRGFRAIAVAAIALILLAGGVAAQGQDQSPDQTPAPAPRPVPPGGGTLLDALDFHPTYSTTYGVNRTANQWDQSLGLTHKIFLLDFSNTMNLSIRKDKAQSDLRSRHGTMTTKLAYSLSELGSWTVGLQSDLNKTSQLQSLSDAVQNTSNYGLTVDTKLPEQLLHRAVSPLSGFNLTSAANFGYNTEEDVNRRSLFHTTRDSTKISGIFQHYDLGLDGKAGGAVKLTGKLTEDKRSGTSKTRTHDLTLGTITRDEKDTSDNSSRRWDSELDWTPSGKLKGVAQAHDLHEINQYWDPTVLTDPNNPTLQGAQDTKDGKDRGTSVSLDWTPSGDASLHTDMGVSDVSGVYHYQRANFSKHTTQGKFDGKWKIPAFFGPLGTTEVQSTYTVDWNQNVLEQTGNYRQNDRNLRTVVKRVLSQKMQVQLTGDGTLNQFFYSDRSNDRDERRLVGDGVLLYVPTQNINGMFNANWSERQTVNIPGDKSANNNTTTAYRISGEVAYKRDTMTIDQRYTIEADYTFYNFNEDENNLVRTNEVLTTFSETLGHGMVVGLSHQYQFRDSGKYSRDPSAGYVRTYDIGNKETHHVMTLTTSYPIGDFLKVDASQMLDRRRSKVSGQTGVNQTTHGELSIGATMQQKFSDDFTIQADLHKTRSTIEKSYWKIDATVQRNF